MSFYSHTLKSTWYMEDVCTSIYASLEGTKNWTAQQYESKTEREAFVSAFRRCQDLVIKNHLNPEDMLIALDKYHDVILEQKYSSFRKWLYKTMHVEEQAVKIAFDVVNSVIRRFL